MKSTLRNWFWLFGFSLLLPGTSYSQSGEEHAQERKQPIRVCIVVILATTENNVVDEKLTAIAKAVQKRNEELVGFQIHEVLQKSLPVGGSHNFELPEEQECKITIEKERDKNNRVKLSASPTGLGKVTYTCVCNKFFPMVLPQNLKNGDTIIIAILVKPCTGIGP